MKNYDIYMQKFANFFFAVGPLLLLFFLHSKFMFHLFEVTSLCLKENEFLCFTRVTALFWGQGRFWKNELHPDAIVFDLTIRLKMLQCTCISYFINHSEQFSYFTSSLEIYDQFVDRGI